jgi:serine/threonine protein kinase
MADPSPNMKLSLELLRQIDGLCSKYEAALRAGKRPDPAKLLEHLRHPASKSADFPASRLRELPQARRKLLHELLLLELESHAPTEHDGVIAEWIQRFPNYIDVIARAAASGDASNRGVHGQGRTASLRRQPGGSVTSAPHESLPPTIRPEGMRVPKNPPAAPRLPETVDYSPRLGTEEPVPKTVPPLSPTQPPEIGPCAISGSSGSSPNQQEGAPPMRSIGRFQLLSVAGQGSFGTVYRAYDPVLDREVALKVPKSIGREREQIKRFLTEAKAAARLRHPNIVAVFEAGEADGVEYIATEFVSGEPLSRRLERERPSFRQAAQWLRDLALALAYAHGEGVIHRDIKPANIMIGDSQRPQLMDFGLAKVLAEAAPADLQKPVTGAGIQASSATADGAIMGTPAYMAPEQARGDIKAVGPHSDQYSLGAVLYELLTGQRPQLAKRAPGSSTVGSGGIFVQVPTRPRQVNRQIPKNLEAICLKAMAKDPAERYASAADLAVDLQRWLQDDPVNARLVALRQRGKDFQYGTDAQLLARRQAKDLQRTYEERLNRRNLWNRHPLAAPGILAVQLIRCSWRNPKQAVVVVEFAATAILTYTEVIQINTASAIAAGTLGVAFVVHWIIDSLNPIGDDKGESESAEPEGGRILRFAFQKKVLLMMAVAALCSGSAELVRLAMRWPLNNAWYPGVVGPGDSARFYFPAKIDSIAGLWDGQVTSIQAVDDHRTRWEGFTGFTNSSSLGSAVYAKRKNRTTQSAVWAGIRIPAVRELERRTLDIRVTVTARFPTWMDANPPMRQLPLKRDPYKRDSYKQDSYKFGENNFEEKQEQFTDSAPLHLATVRAGFFYTSWFWCGFVGGNVLMLVLFSSIRITPPS